MQFACDRKATSGSRVPFHKTLARHVTTNAAHAITCCRLDRRELFPTASFHHQGLSESPALALDPISSNPISLQQANHSPLHPAVIYHHGQAQEDSRGLRNTHTSSLRSPVRVLLTSAAMPSARSGRTDISCATKPCGPLMKGFARAASSVSQRDREFDIRRR